MSFSNVIIPFFAFEYAVVLASFVAIVILEAIIFSFITNLKFKTSIILIATANAFSTILGYFAIGIIRLILLGFFNWIFNDSINQPSSWLNSIITGLSGNMSIDYYNSHPGLPIEVIVNLTTSLALALIASIYIEIGVIKRIIENTKIKEAIIWANIASYIMLFITMIFIYLRVQQ